MTSPEGPSPDNYLRLLATSLFLTAAVLMWIFLTALL